MDPLTQREINHDLPCSCYVRHMHTLFLFPLPLSASFSGAQNPFPSCPSSSPYFPPFFCRGTLLFPLPLPFSPSTFSSHIYTQSPCHCFYKALCDQEVTWLGRSAFCLCTVNVFPGRARASIGIKRMLLVVAMIQLPGLFSFCPFVFAKQEGEENNEEMPSRRADGLCT